MNKNTETSANEKDENLENLEQVNATCEDVDQTSTTEESDESSIEDPKDEVAELQEVIEDQKDKYLRLSAEFDNYRKRTLKEKAELILNGGEKSIINILPIIDDFERAIETMQSATDIDAIKTGVDLIYDKLMKTLDKDGVKVIETINMPLNTDFHEAIAVVPSPSKELKGKIIDCVQRGYTLNEKVIRHAKVVVGE